MIAALQDHFAALHLLRPAWLLLWPVLAAALFWSQRQRQRRSPWTGQVDAHLLPHLLVEAKGGGVRRLPWLPLLAATLFCIALAGPAWRELPQPQMGRQAGLVILLDLSDGMRAGDIPPTRLQRARFKIADLLRQRKDGQTALVAYAGDAFTVAPLTDDATTLEALLGALEPEVMPVPGQRLSRGLELAAQLLQGAGYQRGEVLALTYRASDDDIAVARRLASAGIRVSVLAVGGDVGAPVPLPQGGFLRDAAGNMVLPRLDLDSLRELVAASDGIVATLSSDGSDVASLLASLDADAGEGQLRDDRRMLRFADEGPWVVLVLLPVALLLLRRPQGFAVLPLALLLGLGTAPASAMSWGELWQRPDQRAWQALQEQRYEDARATAESAALRGSAAFRTGDYAGAAQEFATSDDPRDLYNRGTALAQAGELEQALEAFDAALAAQPDFADARHNRDVVQRALDRQQQEQSQDSQSDGKSDSKSRDGEQSSDEEGDGEPNDPAQDPNGEPGGEQGEQTEDEGGESDGDADADPDPVNDEQREAMEQALREAEAQQQDGEGRAAPPLDPAEAEKQQAAEQWLRRIPDDPGGLLRRKFALEHRRRVLEGEK